MSQSARGQTATEYMLLVSVVVIAVVASAYTFVPSFQQGVDSLGRDVSQILATGRSGRGSRAGGNAAVSSGSGSDSASSPSRTASGDGRGGNNTSGRSNGGGRNN